MIPWDILARAPVLGGGELVLRGRGGEYEIRIDGAELMTSRGHGSETALAELACAAIAGQPAPRLLIGGLGMGYTLRAALDRLPTAARVVVAELVPEVADWNRGPLASLAGDPLGDPRVDLRIVDVADVLAAEPGAGSGFDAVLLDVDNGPAALTRAANAGLYQTAGIALAVRALRPGGILAVWSADPCPELVEVLAGAGCTVEAIALPARGAGGGPEHTIVLATACRADASGRRIP